VKLKYISLNDRLYRYVCCCRSDAGDQVLEALRATTESLGDISRMQISREQGSFMTLLVAAIGADTAIEVGTFTGYSSLCIARGLASRGRLICIDQSEEWTAIARNTGRRPALKTKLSCDSARRSDPEETGSPPRVRLAFIDADKTEYDAYYELLLPRIRQNGLILFDNMLWADALGRPCPTTERPGHRKAEPQTGPRQTRRVGPVTHRRWLTSLPEALIAARASRPCESFNRHTGETPVPLYRLSGGPASQPTRQPRFHEQYPQRGHQQPSPQLLLIFQFRVVEPAFLLVLPGQLDFRRLERHAEPHQFFGRHRRRPAFRRIQVDRKTHRRVQRSQGVNTRWSVCANRVSPAPSWICEPSGLRIESAGEEGRTRD